MASGKSNWDRPWASQIFGNILAQRTNFLRKLGATDFSFVPEYRG
jgi:hypothetical protein